MHRWPLLAACLLLVAAPGCQSDGTGILSSMLGEASYRSSGRPVDDAQYKRSFVDDSFGRHAALPHYAD